MSKSRIIVLIVCVLVLLAFTVFILAGTETQFGDLMFGGSGFAPAVPFFVFFGALAGVMKILVDAALPNCMRPAGSKSWEVTRRRGKRRFIITMLMITGTPLLVVLPISGILQGEPAEVIRNYVIATVLLLGGSVAVVNAIWNYKESVYLKTADTENDG